MAVALLVIVAELSPTVAVSVVISLARAEVSVACVVCTLIIEARFESIRLSSSVRAVATASRLSLTSA